MKKLLHALKRLSIRWKMILSVLGILTVTLLGVSVTVSHYSTRYYIGLQQNYSEQIMSEVSYQMNALYASVNELYLTFNSQQPYTVHSEDGSVFQNVANQLGLENSVRSVLSANNLQSMIVGTLFYISDEKYSYVGKNGVAENFSFSQTDWYQKFVASHGKRMLYGPLDEDFKPINTERYNCLYFIAPYNAPSVKGSVPFILFAIRTDALFSPLDAFMQDGREIVVTDRTGEILHDVGFTDTASREVLPRLQEDMRNGEKRFSEFIGNYLVCSYALDNYGWRLSFLDPTTQVMHSINVMNRQISLIILAFASVGILLAVFMIGRITMPLTVLNHYIDVIQDDPDAYIQAEPGTEMGKIGIRFNEMKRNLRKMSEEMYIVRLQEKEAWVSALQAQINPHFLYNTLDNIYCIAQLGETEPILTLSDRLSQMMRYSMSMKQNLVPLALEIQHVENYVAILNTRFDDKLHLVNHIDPALYQVIVLKLSLQPLIENAWQHGLRQGAGTGEIVLSARRLKDVLYFHIDDDGEGVPPERCEELNRAFAEVHYSEGNKNAAHGIGMENINNRIKLTFGADYGLHIENMPAGGCRVTMYLPCSETPPAQPGEEISAFVHDFSADFKQL